MSYIQRPKGSEGVKLNEIRRFWVVLLVSLLLATPVMAAKTADEAQTKTNKKEEVP
jgi:hypothetical protein